MQIVKNGQVFNRRVYKRLKPGTVFYAGGEEWCGRLTALRIKMLDGTSQWAAGALGDATPVSPKVWVYDLKVRKL